jgi:hypothetical protein
LGEGFGGVGEGAEAFEKFFLTAGLAVESGAEVLHGLEEGVIGLLDLVGGGGSGEGGMRAGRSCRTGGSGSGGTGGADFADDGGVGGFAGGGLLIGESELLVRLIVDQSGFIAPNPALHSFYQTHAYLETERD